jgi:V8-like Glu-specific endopeptidase
MSEETPVKHPLNLLAATALIALSATGAEAVEVRLKAPQGVEAQRASAWTDADYAAARPMMKKATTLGAAAYDFNAAAEKGRQQPQVDVAGHRGGADASHLAVVRRVAGSLADAAADLDAVMPEAVGTNNIQFTSSRATFNSAIDKSYPFRTVGKLFFKDATGAGYMCSASVIKPGVVLTAGHCVHSGSGGTAGWYNSFEFIPGYRKVGATEYRPYGTWTSWAQATTTTDWYNSAGAVPNLRDWALIVFNRDAATKRVGDYTGWLGYQYPALIGKHNTVLGYPGNLDSGLIMHRVDSAISDNGGNNGLWGSDMRGGSSGGPAVLNFQYTYSGVSASTLDNGSNRATSVVSWGYISEAPQVQGGSQLDSVFGTMITNTCTTFPWAC